MATKFSSPCPWHTGLCAFPLTPFNLFLKGSAGPLYREVMRLCFPPCQHFCLSCPGLPSGLDWKTHFPVVLSQLILPRKEDFGPILPFMPTQESFVAWRFQSMPAQGSSQHRGQSGWRLQESTEVCFGGQPRELVLLDQCEGG